MGYLDDHSHGSSVYVCVSGRRRVNVARNTIVINPRAGCLSGFCSESVTVEDASGNPATYHYHLLGDNCIPVFYPAELLAANTEHCVEETLACFTTGEEIDEYPPRIVDIAIDASTGSLITSDTAGRIAVRELS